MSEDVQWTVLESYLTNSPRRIVQPIYIGGLPTNKTNIFVWKRFSYMEQACVRELVRTRGMRLGM